MKVYEISRSGGPYSNVRVVSQTVWKGTVNEKFKKVETTDKFGMACTPHIYNSQPK